MKYYCIIFFSFIQQKSFSGKPFKSRNFKGKQFLKQILDLGLPKPSLNNLTAIEEHLETLEDDMDLVLVTELMDESLILMADQFCFPLHYVTYLWKKKRLDRYHKVSS